MADGIGSASQQYKSLSLAEVDRIHDCANKAKGIVTLLRYAAPELGDCPDDAIAGACWAAEGLIEEMERIATRTEGHGNG